MLESIQPACAASRAAALARLDQLTKPRGSLGRLEWLAAELAGITAQPLPRVDAPAVLVFAADHGIAAEGVSAFPQEVSAQMVANFAAGGAAINVLAKQIDAYLEVVDVGVVTSCEGIEGVIIDRVRNGTGNIAVEDAMSLDEAREALMVGVRAVERARHQGCRSLILGEMGIANTSSSSALLAAWTGLSLQQVVGRGTGIDDQRLAHKCRVIEKALSRARTEADPLAVLAQLGGLEIAAMAGACLAAAAARLPVVVDGFIATVAALAATRLCPDASDYLIAGHRSDESGHGHALQALGVEPLLSLGLRLGEGSGAALAYPLLRSACAVLAEMATFDDAGVTAEPETRPL
ncbi:nicotinate-nucleotide--dimethylbenzimidazole phosphoribosyltransferase [Halomonas huangheensis]|nr:nicotinate-nucleotide--dimethylbenzimidazole phosphoribosyltransferase [Halomonas huangheensis]ALM54684.1 nicotinate-nucleotide--dimethylbenzimidazole phosphoribosyltransferase [Halomonas huangheensis]